MQSDNRCYISVVRCKIHTMLYTCTVHTYVSNSNITIIQSITPSAIPSVPRCLSFQLVSGPGWHRYLPILCTCKREISSNQAKTISRLGLFYSRLGPFFSCLPGFKAVRPVLKPSDSFETVQVLNWSLTYIITIIRQKNY